MWAYLCTWGWLEGQVSEQGHMIEKSQLKRISSDEGFERAGNGSSKRVRLRDQRFSKFPRPMWGPQSKLRAPVEWLFPSVVYMILHGLPGRPESTGWRKVIFHFILIGELPQFHWTDFNTHY